MARAIQTGGGGGMDVMGLLMMLNQLEDSKGKREDARRDAQEQREYDREAKELDRQEKRKQDMMGMYQWLKGEMNGEKPKYSDSQIDEIMGRWYPNMWRSLGSGKADKPTDPRTPRTPLERQKKDRDENYNAANEQLELEEGSIKSLVPRVQNWLEKKGYEQYGERKTGSEDLTPPAQSRYGKLLLENDESRQDVDFAYSPITTDLMSRMGEGGALNLETGIGKALDSGRSPEQIAASMSKQLGVSEREMLQVISGIGRRDMNPNVLNLPPVQ